jgi:2-oxoisovalerate dehydrogenase E1 component alpha subunit
MAREVVSDDLITVLAEDASVDKKQEPQIAAEDLKRLYYMMVLNRIMDERMITLQRQGRIGFYIGSVGEEAAVLGSAFALRPTDWIFPSYREAGAAFLRGFPIRKFISQLMGNAEDPVKGRQMPNHYAARDLNITSISSPVGTQIPHGVGAAWAAKIRGEDMVSLLYFGEGTTSTGDFHVGLNFAGVFKLPAIFFCRNNQWAISVPVSRQTASKTIAIKARAYGFDGVRVDGNDILAVYNVTKAAVDKARAGGGPTLIEAYTYRLSGHSTSDDPRAYREEAELDEWKAKDPIQRFRRYLEKRGLWSKEEEETLQKSLTAEIVQTLKEEEKVGPPPLGTMFDDVYAEVPPHLKEQRETLLAAYRKEPK